MRAWFPLRPMTLCGLSVLPLIPNVRCAFQTGMLSTKSRSAKTPARRPFNATVSARRPRRCCKRLAGLMLFPHCLCPVPFFSDLVPGRNANELGESQA